MEKYLVPSLLSFLALITMAFGSYIVNDFSEQFSEQSGQIKRIDSKLESKPGAINSTLNEHSKLLTHIHTHLRRDPNFIDLGNSINKLKPLNDKEFHVLTAALQVTTHNKNAEALI